MTDRPILFSGPMVRALLSGSKTQTRRLLKPQPPEWATFCQQPMLNVLQQWVPSGLWRWSEDVQTPPRPLKCWPLDGEGNHYWLKPRFSVHDRLWVREAWRAMRAADGAAPRDLTPRAPVSYETDGNPLGGRLRASMHMPRWASRLTLTVTDVRIERLQECSEADARAEGIVKVGRFFGLEDADWDFASTESAVNSYAALWESINGPGSWDANPWIAAYTFTVHHQNIDRLSEEPTDA